MNPRVWYVDVIVKYVVTESQFKNVKFYPCHDPQNLCMWQEDQVRYICRKKLPLVRLYHCQRSAISSRNFLLQGSPSFPSQI